MNNPTKQERVDVFKNTVHFENKKRILNVCSYHHWIVYDCGYKLSEATRNYDIRRKMMREFHERYGFDAYRDFWSRNPLRIIDAIGGGGMYIQDDASYSSNVIDLSCITCPEDYDLLRDNKREFFWTRVVPVKYPQLTGENAAKYFQAAYEEIQNYNNYNAETEKMMAEEYGVIDIRKSLPFSNPIESLVSGFQGIKNTSVDMRRHKDKILAYTNSVEYLPNKNTTVGSDPEKGSDIHTALLAHNFLNAKQFEMFEWPAIKALYDYVDEYDKIAYVFIQGTSKNIDSFLSDVPKGHTIMHPELDNIFDFAKIYGDKACIAGGIDTILLSEGTTDQCVDQAKSLVDALAGQGAFMASTDKMLTFPRDAKRENLLAVNEYIRSVKL